MAPPSADPSSTPSSLQGQLTALFLCERLLIKSQPVAYDDHFSERNARPCTKRITNLSCRKRRSSNIAHALHHTLRGERGCVMRPFAFLPFSRKPSRMRACCPMSHPRSLASQLLSGGVSITCDFPFSDAQRACLCYRRSGKRPKFERDPIWGTLVLRCRHRWRGDGFVSG